MKRRVTDRPGRVEKLFAAFFVTAAAFASQGPGPLYTLSTLTGTNPRPASGGGGAESLAQDRQGNLYIGERSPGGVRKVDPSGKITAVAGPGVPVFSTDGAPGTIQLGGSIGVAVDDSGVLYIADTDHHRVLKMTVGGAVSVFAGTGDFGGAGDGGPASAATIAQPFGLALDMQGNLYIGEYGGCRVRRVGTDGAISTYAGTGKFGYNGDGIRATNANLCPWGLAFDEAGDLYIGDYNGGYRVRKVTPDGIIHTVAGTGKGGYNGDGILATSANIYSATGVSVDHAGNLYIADAQNQRVRKVTPDGMISTVAGTGVAGILLGEGRAATLSQLAYPVGVLADSAGNLYITEGLVVKVDSKGKLATIEGFETGDDGGSASTALLGGPTAIALDAGGNIYISTAARRVRKIDQKGLIHTVAGNGEQGYVGDGIAATEAPLNDPRGIAVDGEGNLYIADAGNNRIRKVGLDGMISTVAGTGANGFSGDGGSATSAQLSNPTGVALAGKGTLYIADTGNNRIRKVTPDGMILTVAGTGAAGYTGDGGAATDAQLSSPGSVAADATGNLYIADTENHVVREVFAKGTITTIAGTGIHGWSYDGGFATASTLVAPVSVAVDAEGNLFIADEVRIRRVRRDGTIDTVAGSGAQNYYDFVDGGPGFLLSLLPPQGMVFDATGNLYFSDGQTVRKAAVLRSSGFGAPPVILPQAVVNAVNLSRAPVAPGELVTLFGTDLGPPAGAGATLDASGKIGTNLEGVRVLFDDVPAPVLYAQAYQVNAIVPFGITPKNGVRVRVEYSGNRSATASVNVAEAAPAVFTLNPPSPRGGKAAVLNQDGTINSPNNPAAVGSVIVLYATGAGQMQPAIPDGKISSDTSAKPVLPVSVLFNYENRGDVLYAGPAPGIVAGVLQVNVRVPKVYCSVPNCRPDPNAIAVMVGIGKPDPNNDPNGIVPVAKYLSQVLTTIAVR